MVKTFLSFWKSKKSQYFVVASIIFISLALTLVSTNMMGGKQRDVFDELRENFMTEAYVAINSAVATVDYAEQTVPEKFDDFVSDFIEYSASRNVDFKLVYLLLYQDRIYVKNYMDIPFTVSTRTEQVTMNPMELVVLSSYSYVDISSTDRNFLFIFDESPLQFRSMFELRIRN